MNAEVETALQEFAETFADEWVSEDVAPNLSCLEADALANLLEAMGLADGARNWRQLHSCSVKPERGRP